MYLPNPVSLSGAVVAGPDGVDGVLNTLRHMRAFVRQGRVDPVIRSTALNLLALVPERDSQGEIRALFEFVRDRIRYIADVLDVETLADARRTLETAAGDCDDKAILLAALLESVGIATQFVATGYEMPGFFEHVYLRALVPSGQWLPLDASEPHAMGWEPPAPVAILFE